MADQGFTTTALHSDRADQPEHGALHKPIHTSVAFGYQSARELADIFQNRAKGYAYGRQNNPTLEALAQKITRLEDGRGTVVFSSGMAAIGSSFLALLRAGDHVVASAFLFGNTNSLFATLMGLGVEVSFADSTDTAQVEAALRPNTRLVFVETIANPVTQVADLAGIGELCRRHGLLYVVDNTMTTPWLFRPREVGAGLVVNALTKYVGGHGNALGGSVTDTGLFDWNSWPNIAESYKNTPSEGWGLIQIRKKGLRDFGA